MSKTEYEVLNPLRRNGTDHSRGSTLELSDSEASPLLQGGVLRELPERKSKGGRPRKQASADSESEDSNEE